MQRAELHRPYVQKLRKREEQFTGRSPKFTMRQHELTEGKQPAQGSIALFSLRFAL